MLKKSFFYSILFLISFFTFQNTNAQLSKTHYLPPITSDDPIENQYIYISTPKNNNVNFTITPIGRPSSEEIKGTVSNSKPYTTTSSRVGDQLFQESNNTATIITTKGYIIEADDVIYVSIRMVSSSTFQAAAIVSKGNSALGTDFRMGGFWSPSPKGGFLNFISVMATEDDTNITFDDFSAGISINNYSGSLPFTKNLNRGESFIVSVSSDAGGDPNDLIGTLIHSEKPIVVNSGSATGSFYEGSNNRDYGIDQIVDASKIGTEYIFVRGDGEDEWENVLIVAHENNTEIKVGGTVVKTINTGEFHVIEGGYYNANGNMYIETSKPAFAYQGVGFGDDAANQGLFFVPPLNCESKGNVDNISSIDEIGSNNFGGGVTIVTNTGATVSINGLPTSSFSSTGPSSVNGNPDYVTYKITGLTGNVSVESSEELYCAYFNRNGAATSGSFYSGFPSAPEINFNTTVSSLGNCIPNITLQAANTELFDGGIKWYYYNETTLTWEERSTNSSYKPIASEPGRYKLVGIIDCTGATFESIEIPVSICPDDFDGDLIIDNLDVDLDNDGILNCDESFGNAALNLSDINNPEIIFADNTKTSSITTPIFTITEPTNSFTGNTEGDFVSVINPATDSKLKYEINFNQKINFKFTQNKAFDHKVVAGEFFILKIGPNSKNITLLDPDDQLLIDTNFDGEFEDGITNISASEIWYKYKSNTTGAASTFEFLANQVDQIDFKHQSSGIAATSTFNGNIQLTCFSLDSDGDGIENMFDLDSDNDGIPDISEASSPQIILSNLDVNQDGLDDIFNGIITNIDTDNDGIPNYLDVDSDNDGIFDLAEAGHNLVDTNNDGIIDDANATSVGINGLINNLETTADNAILNYTITDTDSDTILNFLELDSDDDACFDTKEAGFTDANSDGIIDASPFQVDTNGKVLNITNGYTTPNLDYITSAPIVITKFEDEIFCEASTDTITIETTADSFQWWVSIDGTTWNIISDDAIYSESSTNSLKLTNIPLTYNNNKYRVVLNRTGNACTITSDIITLTVNPKPIVTAIVELKQCDDDLDRISTINLTEAEISISSNYKNETFTYFATEAHAIAGTPEITDKLRYPVNQNGEAWVRTISTEGCYNISKINLEVEASADVIYNKEFPAVCDDFLQTDGTNGALNNDTDGITNFNFSDAESEILFFFPAILRPDLEVSYYESKDDRTAVINKITDISNYRNIGFPSNITRQTIYFKITNKNNNNCNGTGELYLKTNSVPTAKTVDDLELCDDINDGDATNGIVQSFNLESQTATILGTQNPADFTVTYHDSAANANSGNDPLSSPFTNSVRDLQTIYVRVTNNSTGCFTDHTTFNLIVNPLPIANFVGDLEVCDDNTDGSARNGFSDTINLESQTAGILGTQDPSLFTVTYHRSLAEAQNGNSPLVSPYTNLTPYRETIYVRVYNADAQCANGISNFDVIVNPEPTFETISNLSECDNNDDFDDANNIIQTIDLDGKIPEILGASQDPDDFNVTFHSSKANATSGDLPISSPYENSSATETIYVRIQNKKTGCINDDAFFDVIVNPLPDFTVTTPQILCLNNLPLNIFVENQKGTYEYVWKYQNGDTVSTEDNVNISVAGTYTVTATTTNGTFCSRTETIVINESNIATLENSFITIIDESNNIGSESNLSIAINTIDNDLGPGDYQFAIENTDENTRIPFAGFQDDPLFENLEGGIYKIIVNDKNGCSPDTTLLVSVIQFPKFFTPNADGDNDTWIVRGANKTFYPNSSINIFNRYGKLVAQLPIDGQGWDGTYGGKTLSSDDYWFNVTLIPADITKPAINKKGHFSLIRK
ncbi:gliding motility-associated C-terminal domain-containing protein [Polaribacter sp. KT25b]|uniref:T9SS type B sorting domain-containing protein n=1 Tax=Polaribacter sp. KT25b TaxID=1855336 RepID=UPI00087B2FFF|nr:T9SS type B sorting domain-containing protein [Polaribacter sp. KT25b]SDR79054.1 gliding motility-associated C-terminal domain-containing protein [Polaribacter sp. KT25b]